MSVLTSRPTAAPTSPVRRRSLALAAALTLLAAIGATACDPLPPAPPGGTAADCRDIHWGSAAKHATRRSPSEILRVRAGRHRCFDRMVIDLRSAPAAGWHVRYHEVTRPGTGTVVPLRGTAPLEVIALAPAYGKDGTSAFRPAKPTELVDVSAYRTFRQLAFAGSFEGESTFGVGVRSRLPFRVFGMEGPSGTMLVVDVAHAWAR